MDISLGVVRLLVLLVNESVLGSAGAGGHVGVGVLGDVLVGLLGSSGTGALHGLGDVVGGVLEESRCVSLDKSLELWLGMSRRGFTNLDGLHCDDCESWI